MNKAFYQLVVAASVSITACSVTTLKNEVGLKEESGCLSNNSMADIKAQFEKSIVSKTLFTNEEDTLVSIQERLEAVNIPSLSLAVMNDGVIEWSTTYNALSNKSSIDCNTRYQVASLSKPVTVMAAIRLQSNGYIDFNENIENYLKSYYLPKGKQTNSAPITFQNILDHSSGINAGGFVGYEQGALIPTDIEILQGSKHSNSAPLTVVNKPGAQLAYSGTAYTLAQVALKDTLNTDFASIMDKWILTPLGMENSSYLSPNLSSINQSDSRAQANSIAKGHDYKGEQIKGGWKVHPELAAAGMWSNANDMATFMLEIYKGYQGKSTLFSQSEIKQMLENEKDGHVYGFILNHEGDDITLTHFGGNVGYRTGMSISLTTGDGLVYLLNSDNGAALGNQLMLTASKLYDWSSFKQIIKTKREAKIEILKSLAGNYLWNEQLELSISYDDEHQQISLHFPNGDQYKLTPIEGHGKSFIHQDTATLLSFSSWDKKAEFTVYGQLAVKMK